jgi:uncharacterized membrane protein YedE/YeeE
MNDGNPIPRLVAALLSGAIFGIGLAISGMTHPDKVLDFLDVTGNWDASLLLVLGGAVGVTLIAFRFILRRDAPVLDSRFYLPTATRIDARLVGGAVLFGIGWGIAGFCPGPAIALLAAPGREAAIVLIALFAGRLIYTIAARERRPPPV